MNGLAIPLAVLACCLAGALGGFTLVRPAEALERLGLGLIGAGRAGLSDVRSFGGMILLAHGGAAALLGYSPTVGADMALALSLAWGGAVAGRIVSTLKDGPGDGRTVQTLVFEVLMSITLALPFFMARNALPGPTIPV